MRVMFMGTPDFAVESLKAIQNSNNEIECVITMPDKARGRGNNVSATPVGEYSLKNSFKVYKPENLKKENFEEILNEHNPDVIVVVAYGMILPEYVLNYPRYGCINVHASLLPKYRGAAPIQRAIIDGEKITGVTTMYMNKGLDTGDMLLKESVVIEKDDNFETLHDKLAQVGSRLIVATLNDLAAGNVVCEKQNDSDSTYAHMITKETAAINWSNTAEQINNLVRGLYPIPKAYTLYNNKRMKICKAEVSCECHEQSAPGTVVSIAKDSFSVQCGFSTVLKILSVQPEGKREMAAVEYLNGNQFTVNAKLGE